MTAEWRKHARTPSVSLTHADKAMLRLPPGEWRRTRRLCGDIMVLHLLRKRGLVETRVVGPRGEREWRRATVGSGERVDYRSPAAPHAPRAEGAPA